GFATIRRTTGRRFTTTLPCSLTVTTFVMVVVRWTYPAELAAPELAKARTERNPPIAIAAAARRPIRRRPFRPTFPHMNRYQSGSIQRLMPRLSHPPSGYERTPQHLERTPERPSFPQGLSNSRPKRIASRSVSTRATKPLLEGRPANEGCR